MKVEPIKPLVGAIVRVDKANMPPKATMLSARCLSATIEASVRPVFGHPPQERIDRWRRMAAPMEHPVVWTHENGRKSLILGSHADGLVGWPGPHGNNPGMMHRVVPYTDTRRVMHRTVIAGTERPGRIAPAESMTKMLEPIGS